MLAPYLSVHLRAVSSEHFIYRLIQQLMKSFTRVTLLSSTDRSNDNDCIEVILITYFFFFHRLYEKRIVYFMRASIKRQRSSVVHIFRTTLTIRLGDVDRKRYNIILILNQS